MTDQELKQDYFNRAVAGLASQGFERSLKPNAVASCAYRGVDGRRCALGWLIPDEKYNTVFDNGGSYYVAVCEAVGFPAFGDSPWNFGFYADLQTAHDEGVSPTRMRSNLVNFANLEGLELPEVLK